MFYTIPHCVMSSDHIHYDYTVDIFEKVISVEFIISVYVNFVTICSIRPVNYLYPYMY